MAVFFFSVDRDIKEVSRLVFKSLNFYNSVEGDSMHVLNNTYTQAYTLGHKIRLEENSYDYEDQYNYMMTISKDFLADVETNNEVQEYLADAIALLLKINLAIEIVREKGEDLVVV